MSKLTYAVEVQLWTGTAYSTTWTDITADVIMPGLKCFSGTRGSSIKDRVSDIGTCTFDLNNSETNSAKLVGYYSPLHTNTRTGFDIGCPIRVRFTFEGLTRTKWYGRIYGIAVEPGTMLTKRTHITAYDWMYQASKYTLKLPSYETTKRMDEGMLIVSPLVPIQPLSFNYSTGHYTFPTIFDNVNYKTTALAEYQKLATSEFGNIYLLHNLAGDEILTGSNVDRRNVIGYGNYQYTLPNSASSKLLDEDGSVILDEDGSNLLSDDVANLEFSNDQMELGYAYGDKLYNHVEATTYPRNVNNSVGVLFTMDEPVKIAAGETVSWYRVIYKDPDSRAISICAKDIVPVVATTDYLFNTAADGSGTNITSDLAITGVYGVNDTEFTFTNNNALDGYITKLQIRGKAIYLYDKVTNVAKYQPSIDQYGLHEFSYDIPYQSTVFASQSIASAIIGNYADPFSANPPSDTPAFSAYANSITFSTRTDEYIQKFLAIDCNSAIDIIESQTAIDCYFFVQGWNFEIISNNDQSGILIQETLYLYKQERFTYTI